MAKVVKDEINTLRIGLALHSISQLVSDEDLAKIKPYLQDIENAVMDVIKADDKEEA